MWRSGVSGSRRVTSATSCPRWRKRSHGLRPGSRTCRSPSAGFLPQLPAGQCRASEEQRGVTDTVERQPLIRCCFCRFSGRNAPALDCFCQGEQLQIAGILCAGGVDELAEPILRSGPHHHLECALDDVPGLGNRFQADVHLQPEHLYGTPGICQTSF